MCEVFEGEPCWGENEAEEVQRVLRVLLGLLRWPISHLRGGEEQQVHKSIKPGWGEPRLQTQEEAVWR